MSKIILFADNLKSTGNSLKIWSRGDTPVNVTQIKVTQSEEAGKLSKLVDPASLEYNSMNAGSVNTLATIVAKAYADGVVTEAEQRAIDEAAAYTNLKKTEAEAYADGIVTAEEQRAIDDAQAKYDAAVAYTEGWSENGATNDSDIRHSADVTQIDGGKIFAGSSVRIGNLDGISDYCRIDDGDIKFYQYLGGDHRLTKSLKRMEIGVCENDTECLLSGYWATQPSVIVSPNDLQIYSSAYTGSDQSIICHPANVYPIGDGQYAFTPNAELIISDGSYSEIFNLIDSDTAERGPVNVDSSGAAAASGNLSMTTGIHSGTIYGQCWGRYVEDSNVGWVQARPFFRIHDDSGWSSRHYSSLTTYDSQWKPVSYSFSGYSNVDAIEVGLYWVYGYAYENLPDSGGAERRYVDLKAQLQSVNTNVQGKTVLATGTLNYIALAQ